MKILFTLAGLLSSVIFSAGCASDNGDKSPAYPKPAEGEMAPPAEATPVTDTDKEVSPQTLDIVDLAASDPNFSTLVSALTTAGLVDTLRGEGPFTVFAPTNAAFAKIPAETLAAIMADKEKLTALLTHHVAKGLLLASDVAERGTTTMLDGRSLVVDTSDGIKIGSATIDKPDLEAKNGVIHVIDTVLIPE